MKTIPSRVVREILKKLPNEVLQSYEAELLLYQKILNQKKQDKNKTYSIHKPFTASIAKGKAHKQYEFGIGIMVNPKSLVILAVKSYEDNPHDSRTIEPLLDQIQENLNYQPEEVIYDKGGRCKAIINGVTISSPTYIN